MIRVLVIDDTIVFRKIIGDALSAVPGVEVVGKAGNGKTAIMRIKDLNPDIITLDIEMPEMDGLEVLEVLKREELNVGVIMLSAFTVKGGEMTIKALQLGAFDFITKPDSGTSAENIKTLTNALAPIIKAWRGSVREKEEPVSAKKTISVKKTVQTVAQKAYFPDSTTDLDSHIMTMSGVKKSGMVVLGISTGGPAALAQMLPCIPEGINVPILIVQHMPPIFTQSLAKSLNAKCLINVKEAEDGETVKAGTAYIAPGGKQMKITRSASGGDYLVKITDDPPENNCKPSVDYLFRSAASVFPEQLTAVVMTGMGNDGVVGMRLIKRKGGITLVQNEESCVVYGMPMEVVRAGAADIVVPLEMISRAIEKTAGTART